MSFVEALSVHAYIGPRKRQMVDHGPWLSVIFFLNIASWLPFVSVGICSEALKLKPSFQRQCNQRMKKMKVWKRKMRRSMGRHCVGLVGRTMQPMSSGFAVMSVRNGSMESVLRSPQQGLSTLNSTNAHLVATRELGLDDGGTGDCVFWHYMDF